MPSATKPVESSDEMTPEYRKTVLQMLESQAYREVMAAHVFGHALKHVPSLKYKKMIAHHIKEELEHYEEVVELYRQFGGNLEAVTAKRIEENPVPYVESWFELAMAQFLYDRAGEFHLSEYKNCSYRPYARIIGKILEEEEGHEGFGETALRELCQDPERRKQAQALFNKWLPVALLSFGRPGTPGNKFAVEAGLKTRDSGQVMQDFLNDIKPTMVACSLTFPPRNRFGVELPPEIDLSLPQAA